MNIPWGKLANGVFALKRPDGMATWVLAGGIGGAALHAATGTQTDAAAPFSPLVNPQSAGVPGLQRGTAMPLPYLPSSMYQYATRLLPSFLSTGRWRFGTLQS